jgi:formylglycine-generating enzyme required for sulfatase activity
MIVGFETVYCFQCKKRLSEKDFQEGAALHIDSHTACRDCSEVFLAQMTAEEQKAVFEQSRITVSSRKQPETTRDTKPAPRQTASLHPPPPQKKKRPVALIAGIGAAALVLIIVILAVVLRSGTPASRETGGKTGTRPGLGDAGATKGTGGGDAGTAATLNKLPEAAGALRKARDYARDNPADFTTIVRLFEAAARAAEGTRLAEEALRDRDAAQARCSQAIQADAAGLEKTIRSLGDRKAYGEAFGRIDAARRRYGFPEWDRSLARLEKEIENAVQGSYVRLVSRAVDFAKLGNAAEAKPLREEVVAWGIPRYVSGFDKALAEAARGGNPLPVAPAAATSAETKPDPVAVKPEPPPRPEPEPKTEPKPEPASVQPSPVPLPPPPPPALPELWALLAANKARLAGKSAPVKLGAPLDKATAVVDDVTESALVMSATFGGGRVGAAKKAEELEPEELKKLLVLAGVAITPELEKRLADLVAERERAKAAVACAKEVEAAKERMEQKDWKGAVAILDGALRLKPDDPEAAALLAEARGRLAPKSLTLDLGNGVSMEFVYIKPGTFVMGGESSSESRFGAVEMPRHEVTITKGFYLGKHEVTQAQYEAVMGQNPSKSTRDPACPVDNVPWDQALAFCKKVAEKTGRPVRLPTEAEWEYACRAGTETPWSHGGDPAALGDYAWFDGNAGGASHPVGQKKPNPWGLHDMHGNVCERIADFYHRDYYASSPKQDPTGPEGRYANGNNGTTLLRGGTWKDGPDGCKSGKRLRGGGFGVYNDWGLRAAMTTDGGGAAGR